MTVLIFFIVLSVLVIVHELGHFIVAKRAGMKVEEFGFGFPPRLFGFKRGETLYSVNLIPFGGFVKVVGEDGQDRDNPRSFGSKSFSQRFAVILAGVIMNILLAVVLLTFVNIAGLRIGLSTDDPLMQRASDIQVQVSDVVAGSPAEKAGLNLLDQIVGFRDQGRLIPVSSVESVKEFIDTHRGVPVTMVISNGEQREVTLTPRVQTGPNEGAVGIAMVLTGVVRYPWYQAIIKGIEYTAITFANTCIGLAFLVWNLVTTGTISSQVSGPVGIAIITGQAARIGFAYLLQFVALISVNLAVLNVIPFPALDGGRALFLLIERIKGSPISQKIEGTIHALGFALLIVLMIYVTTRDVLRFF